MQKRVITVMRQDIKSMLLPEIKEYFISIGEKPFRALQTLHWLHSGVKTFGAMTDLPIKRRITSRGRIT